MTTATTHRAPATTPVAGGDAFAGIGTLVRFNLRRDRIRIPVWILALVGITASTASSFPQLYPTLQERQARASLMESPAATAMSGPSFGVADYQYGAMLANEMLGFLAIFVALMSVLMVVRHTRAEEESGRAELVRAGIVGRHAHLTAALVVAAITNLMLAAVMTLALGGQGVESITWTGSLAFSLALAAVGLVFAGFAAVTAQVFEHGRAASGLAGALIGVAFLLRAAGDIGDGTLSWISPIGWAQQVRAYVDERWWPLLLALAVAAVAVGTAYWLSTKRDVGLALRNVRLGADAASPALWRPLGFALRLHRASLIAWSTGMFLFGAMYGSIAPQVEEFVRDNPAMQDFIVRQGGGSIMETWLGMIISILAMVASIYAILAVLRARSEETTGRAEPVLATGLTRTPWLTSHLVVAVVGGSVVLLLSGLGLGISAAGSTGDWSLVFELLGASAAYLPALWLAAGLTAALFGWLPRAIQLAWVVLVYGLLVGMLGGLLQLPEWLLELSPYSQVPQLPGAEFELLPLVVLTAIAAGLIALGYAGFRQRDLESV